MSLFGKCVSNQILIHSICQVTTVEQFVVFGDFFLQIILRIVRVKKLTQPQHAQVTLDSRGRGEPAIGPLGGFEVITLCDSGYALPLITPETLLQLKES